MADNIQRQKWRCVCVYINVLHTHPHTHTNLPNVHDKANPKCLYLFIDFCESENTFHIILTMTTCILPVA